MAGPSVITSAYVDEHTVRAKCSFFVTAQVWPLHDRLDHQGWLQNFTASERPYALQLLNAVLYFRTSVVDQMYIAAFRALSKKFYAPGEAFQALQSKWQSFIDTSIFTNVTGEDPAPTDSGYAYTRRARDLLNVKEPNILSPHAAVQKLYRHGGGPVVFVDDFVGSGNQFRDTWERPYQISPQLQLSFRDLAARPGAGPFYYIPVLCTDVGRRSIAAACPAVRVEPAHVLGDEYSALHQGSVLWPQHLLGGARDFIYRASMRCGIPDAPGSVDHYEGFRSLGLTVAFDEGCPDATLPLLRWNQNGWIPLFRKSAQ